MSERANSASSPAHNGTSVRAQQDDKKSAPIDGEYQMYMKGGARRRRRTCSPPQDGWAINNEK